MEFSQHNNHSSSAVQENRSLLTNPPDSNLASPPNALLVVENSTKETCHRNQTETRTEANISLQLSQSSNAQSTSSQSHCHQPQPTLSQENLSQPLTAAPHSPPRTDDVQPSSSQPSSRINIPTEILSDASSPLSDIVVVDDTNDSSVGSLGESFDSLIIANNIDVANIKVEDCEDLIKYIATDECPEDFKILDDQ